VVCDTGTLCALHGTSNRDCLPQCTSSGATVYRSGGNCEARGLSLEEATGKCFVTCFQDECLVLGDNYCGPPVDFSKAKDSARIVAVRRIAS
jgi:hypothetical protein